MYVFLGRTMKCFWPQSRGGIAPPRRSAADLRMMEVVSGDNWSCKTCKAPVKSQWSNTQLFTGRMAFLSPNQRHGRRKRGYAGIWHPNYLCGGDIDMYIPPRKT